MAPRPNSITLRPVLDPKAFDVADVVTGREHVAMLGRGGMAIRHAEPGKEEKPRGTEFPGAFASRADWIRTSDLYTPVKNYDTKNACFQVKTQICFPLLPLNHLISCTFRA